MNYSTYNFRNVNVPSLNRSQQLTLMKLNATMEHLIGVALERVELSLPVNPEYIIAGMECTLNELLTPFGSVVVMVNYKIYDEHDFTFVAFERWEVEQLLAHYSR